MKKGDILYVIDARPYQATLKQAQAELTRARTQAALAQSERERATQAHREARHLAGRVRRAHLGQ